VSLQDPFAEGNDPAFPRRNLTPNSGYQSGMSTPEMQGRMGPYEPNKDPFGAMRKGTLPPGVRRLLLDERRLLLPLLVVLVLLVFWRIEVGLDIDQSNATVNGFVFLNINPHYRGELEMYIKDNQTNDLDLFVFDSC